MIAFVWKYDVRDEHRTAFEAFYGPGGEWAKLFARGIGFLETQLLRGSGDSYLTLDLWRTRADFDAFLAEHRSAYEALDAATRDWTRDEQCLGEFELLS